MLAFIPRGPVLGTLTFVYLVLNTLFWAVPLFLCSLVKLLSPTASMRGLFGRAALRCAELWMFSNNAYLRSAKITDWQITGCDTLERSGSYLVAANHRSWADIPALHYALGGRIQFLTFFLKKELVWVPILGQAWWALEFPFMQRFSKEYLAKHPEMRGKDLETTRALCDRLRGRPVAIMNFLEGTRYEADKAAEQASPYRHLLKPKAGGVAFVIGAMGDQLQSMLDVTLAYPGRDVSIWEFICGLAPRVVIDVRQREIPARFVEGDYQGDDELRAAFQDWLTGIWADKDAFLGALDADHAPRSAA